MGTVKDDAAEDDDDEDEDDDDDDDKDPDYVTDDEEDLYSISDSDSNEENDTNHNEEDRGEDDGQCGGGNNEEGDGEEFEQRESFDESFYNDQENAGIAVFVPVVRSPGQRSKDPAPYAERRSQRLRSERTKSCFPCSLSTLQPWKVTTVNDAGRSSTMAQNATFVTGHFTGYARYFRCAEHSRFAQNA